MKFGKRLRKQIDETLPQWRDKFLCYKELKRLVRRTAGEPLDSAKYAEAEFVSLLDAEVEKLNVFFVEMEEEFVIRLKETQEKIRNVNTKVRLDETRALSETEYEDEMRRIWKEVVNLHGEMVLLENYSNINYTGLAKILKKYDKRTGGLLRLPFIEKLLKQPFFATDLISELVKECENMMEAVFPGTHEQAGEGDGEAEEATEHTIFRNTVAALTTMKELRKESSKSNFNFSIPPLSSTF